MELSGQDSRQKWSASHFQVGGLLVIATAASFHLDSKTQNKYLMCYSITDKLPFGTKNNLSFSFTDFSVAAGSSRDCRAVGVQGEAPDTVDWRRCLAPTFEHWPSSSECFAVALDCQ